jgi:hypothetical protein
MRANARITALCCLSSLSVSLPITASFGIPNPGAVRSNRAGGINLLFGVVGLMIILRAILSTWIEPLNRSPVIPVLIKILVFLEYFPKSNCTNVQPTEQVAFLADTKISVASLDEDGNYKFQNRSCVESP